VSNDGGPGGPADMGGESVGSVGEEAAKLFGALAGLASDVSDHVDTGSPECSYCPICRTVHVIRQASPEVRDHLATAATSLMQAAAGVLAATARAGSHPSPHVEHIDLDADSGDWPEEER
jgi:hypothetical protein